MKVIITGSHNTGKTTFCNYMYEKYNYPIIFEGSRELMNSFDYSYNHRKHHLFFQATLSLFEKKKNELFLSLKKCIMDRCALDIIAYTNYAYNHISNKNFFINEIYSTIINQCEKLFNEIKTNIDLIVFVKNQNIKDFYANEIEQELLKVFEKYKVTFFKVNTFPTKDKTLIRKLISPEYKKISNIKKIY